ncbi:MAG TPA: hypothetical protein VGS01_11240 [Candidatus Limnocylindria bacterium]|jgi:hypothetical protein|nr:hypothetical protein [Candidatus Limnocylindria bacterium]
MTRLLAVVALFAVVLSACSQSQPAPMPVPTACAEPTRVTGLTPFDEANRSQFAKDLAASGSAVCDAATRAYITRLEDKKEEQLYANASTFAIIGRVTDAASGAPLEQVCITPGKPGAICWSRTDRDGWYLLDLGSVFAHEGFYEIFFVKAGYPEQHNTSRMLSGRARLDYQMTK